MLKIALVDYGVGNLHSLKKSLENCGANVTVVTDMEKLLSAECMAFPGVGAFDKTMEKLIPYKDDILKRMESGVPCLGICIGTQIQFSRSEEGVSEGIGLFEGNVKKLKTKTIPHMGWNSVETEDQLFENIESRHFYFAHSYYCEPTDKKAIVGKTEYEGFVIPTFFRKNNFVGTQFHPEKSSGSGMKFLTNFIQFAEEEK